jgi:hypothetical protein
MKKDSNIVYRLNSQDEFIYLNEEWINFAVANDAPDLLPAQVLNRPLWDFIADVTTKQLYREILRQVRAGLPARFTFRCDAPKYRRRMEMTVEGREGGEVQFETRTLQQEERPRQELLDRHAPRAGDLLRMCGWCKGVDIGGGKWGEVEEAVTALHLFERKTPPQLTHGICEACFNLMREVIAEKCSNA